jgi:hypothetical protein
LKDFFVECQKPVMAQPAPGKSCGSCTECCRIVGVDELAKPAGTPCAHCTNGVGCRIYADRPESCRTFMCDWLAHPQLGPELRPDRCHVVLMHLPESRGVVAGCDPEHPDAWRAPAVINLLRRLAAAVPPDWRVFAAVADRIWQITERGIKSETGELSPFV